MSGFKSRNVGRETDRGRNERVVIETVQGPASYVPGGFTTGVDTSSMRKLRRIQTASVLEGITLRSGAIANNASGNFFAQIVSAGISGNQVGIACFNMSGVESGAHRLAELVSGVNLHTEIIKIIAQGD